MASFLLQENGSRFILEDGSGFLLLEDSVGPDDEEGRGGRGGYLKPIEWVEDEDALAATLILTL